tara:strand:+ start:200 stop:367 length:168 start_codon:yes stop_codon:yes gene_type:complete
MSEQNTILIVSHLHNPPLQIVGDLKYCNPEKLQDYIKEGWIEASKAYEKEIPLCQ